MERYIKELVEIYTSNTLKSKEELESLKKLIMNAHSWRRIYSKCN